MSLRAHIDTNRDGFRLRLRLELPEPGVLGVLGPSGAGKSTLLRILAGLEHQSGNALWVDGQCWQDEHSFVAPEQRAVGYLAQQPGLFTHLDVAGNIDYGYRRTPLPERRIDPGQVIELLGIGHLLRRRVETLSGGEVQRVALARALATSPRLLLLDEPLAALDRQRRSEILSCLWRLHSLWQLPMVYVSHERDEIEQLAGHLLLLEQGQALAQGPLGELLTRLDLPLAQANEAVAVLEGQVLARDGADGLTRLATPAGELLVAGIADGAMAGCRLRIRAQDVSVSLEPPRGSSILNLLPAEVLAVVPGQGGLTTLQLAVGDSRLLSRVTSRSARELQLAPGRKVTAQIKCSALQLA